jgi:hypothetical protein
MSKPLKKPDNRIYIPFHIHPYEFEKGCHAVEKSDDAGVKHRYLIGTSSGMKEDGHGERMTKDCIDYMQEQANKGSILLYEGQHGVTHSMDLGKLVKSVISPTGEWKTEYRLYDESDGFEKGGATLERADKLWRQVNGLPPYVDETGKSKPLQKGFSIEGYIPDGGIVTMSDTGQRVIARVDLDGVLVTPRPSYQDSVITAVYKALDELTPEKRISFTENIRGKFMNKIEDENRKQSYYSQRYKLEDALNESIEDIVNRGVQVKDKLDLLMREYSSMLVELVVSHSGVFIRPEDQPDLPDDYGSVDVAKVQRLRVLKDIQGLLNTYMEVKDKKTFKSKSEEKNNVRFSKHSRGRQFRRKANMGKYNKSITTTHFDE